MGTDCFGFALKQVIQSLERQVLSEQIVHTFKGGKKGDFLDNFKPGLGNYNGVWVMIPRCE